MNKINVENIEFFPNEPSFRQLDGDLDIPVVIVADIRDFVFDDNYFYKKLYKEEKRTAKNLKFEKSRKTYILAHFVNHYYLQTFHFNPGEKTEYQVTRLKKPYFRDRHGLCFNISHAGDMVALAYYKNEVGIDIDQVRANSRQINLVSKRFFTLEENFLINEDHELFYKFWTKKEAILKAVGCGITDEITKIETSGRKQDIYIDDREFRKYHNKSLFVWTRRLDGYYLSLCSGERFPMVKLVKLRSKDIDYASQG